MMNKVTDILEGDASIVEEEDTLRVDGDVTTVFTMEEQQEEETPPLMFVKGEPQEPAYRDKFWAFLFWLHLAAVVATAIYMPVMTDWKQLAENERHLAAVT